MKKASGLHIFLIRTKKQCNLVTINWFKIKRPPKHTIIQPKIVWCLIRNEKINQSFEIVQKNQVKHSIQLMLIRVRVLTWILCTHQASNKVDWVRKQCETEELTKYKGKKKKQWTLKSMKNIEKPTIWNKTQILDCVISMILRAADVLIKICFTTH